VEGPSVALLVLGCLAVAGAAGYGLIRLFKRSP
jgi:hypothetical protein